MQAKDFLHSIVESLVTYRDAIILEEKKDELWILLSLSVDTQDMGIIIWKNGKTIDALRTVMRVFGSQTGDRINIRLMDEKPTL